MKITERYDAQSVQSGTGRLSCSRTAMKRCTETRWYRWLVSLVSLENEEILLPRSFRSRIADALKTPKVSTAIGSNMWRPTMLAYFTSLRVTANSAAAHASRAASVTCYYYYYYYYYYRVPANFQHVLLQYYLMAPMNLQVSLLLLNYRYLLCRLTCALVPVCCRWNDDVVLSDVIIAEFSDHPRVRYCTDCWEIDLSSAHRILVCRPPSFVDVSGCSIAGSLPDTLDDAMALFEVPWMPCDILNRSFLHHPCVYDDTVCCCQCAFTGISRVFCFLHKHIPIAAAAVW